MFEDLPRTRKAAKEAGLKTYFTGKPCVNGHITFRYVACGCSQCSLDRANIWNSERREALNEKARARYKKRPEFESERQRRYVAANPDTRRRVARASADGMRKKKPFYNVLSTCKLRAKKMGVAFDIDNDFLMTLYEASPNCPIFGHRMLLSFEPGRLRDRCSIDRKDPKGGYTRDNVALISYAANTMKSDHTDPELFERMAAYIRAK